jgi:hypothetical protein
VTDETTDTSILYGLVEAVAPFAVSITGELTITAALDRDTKDSYTLKIEYVHSLIVVLFQSVY